MFLSDIANTSSIQSVNLVLIRRLQGCEDSDVTGLELVRSMRGETA
jgi:hypothetical protein